MSTDAIGHAKSDRPQLIEKIKVLQLIEERITSQNQEAQKLLYKGVIDTEDDFLLDEVPGNNIQDDIAYATTAALIVELKTIYNKITQL